MADSTHSRPVFSKTSLWLFAGACAEDKSLPRLREFRRVPQRPDGSRGPIEFLSFSSFEGDALLVAYVKSLSPDELEAFTGFP